MTLGLFQGDAEIIFCCLKMALLCNSLEKHPKDIKILVQSNSMFSLLRNYCYQEPTFSIYNSVFPCW